MSLKFILCYSIIIIGIQEISHNPRDSTDSEARVPEVDRQEGPNSFTETRESVARMAHEWVEHSEGRSLIAAVVGKPGVGKSTIINNLLGLEGETKCPVGECATVTTSRVQIHMNRLLYYNIDIALVDTPGLETFTPNMSTNDILKDLTRVTQGRADVLLYCISIHPACRINAADVEIIKSLNKAYGSEIWNHVILVLTFADHQAFRMSEVIERFADRFQEALHSAHVTDVRVRSVFSKAERVGRVITAIPIGNDRTATFNSGRWYDLLLREIISRSDPTAAPQILKKNFLSFKRD